MKTIKYIFITLLLTLSTFAMSAKKTWPEMSLFHMDSKWQNHTGKTVGLDSLSGNITLVAMVYTSCEHTCPMIISKLQKVKRLLPKKDQKKVKLALISFDPEGDTPKQLAKFKKQRKLGDNWSLLTGKNSGIRKLAAVLGVSYKKEAEGVFSHSNVISVLGKDGVVESQINELNENAEDMVKTIIKLIK